jgi:hypothetical protein
MTSRGAGSRRRWPLWCFTSLCLTSFSQPPLFYFLSGLWIGSRLAVTGLALAVLTLVGYYLFPAYFLLWMAVVGGGALILAGAWLRTA